MNKTNLIKLMLSVSALLFIMSFITVPCWATSERMAGEDGYAVQDATMEDTARNYSGGMDVVYAQVAEGTAAAKTRCFLKAEDTMNWSDYTGTVKAMLYDQLGNLVQEVAEVAPGLGVYSGTAKLNPAGDTIWLSDTKDTSDSGSYYTVSANLDTMTFGTATEEFVLPGAWEVDWPTAGDQSGTAFFVGKEANYWSDPHAIFIRANGAWQKVVEIGGYSNGMAFDNAGNLWCGSYTSSGPADQQYVYMYKADTISAAISNGSVLTPALADETIALPTFVDDDGTTYYTAPNDFECDPEGNVYITINGGFDVENDIDTGFVVMIANDGNDLPDEGYSQEDLIYLAKTNPTSGWNWQKALAYDGESFIDDATDNGYTDPTESTPTANRLFVDQDYGWSTGGPDIVTAITRDEDNDADGVPDAIDNAPETANADQTDTDHDMYGNAADADFNNDGSVTSRDLSTFRTSYRQSEGDEGYNPDCDMNSDGTVTSRDLSAFRLRMRTQGPYY